MVPGECPGMPARFRRPRLAVSVRHVLHLAKEIEVITTLLWCYALYAALLVPVFAVVGLVLLRRS